MQAKVFQQDGCIFIEGAVVFDTVSKVQKDITALLIQQQTNDAICLLDLTAINSVDSAALAMLIELKKWAGQRQLTLQFIHPTELLMSLAQVYGVARWLAL